MEVSTLVNQYIAARDSGKPFLTRPLWDKIRELAGSSLDAHALIVNQPDAPADKPVYEVHVGNVGSVAQEN